MLLLANLVGQALFRRRGRLAAALSSLAVGAALLVGLVAVSLEMPTQMSREFRAYGANVLVTPAAGSDSFTDAVWRRVVGELPDAAIVAAAPELYGVVSVNRQPLTLVGVDWGQAPKAAPYWQITGAWPAGRGEVLVGAEAAQSLALSPGQTLILTRPHETRGAAVKITGVLRTGQSEEGFVFADRTIAAEILGRPGLSSLARLSLVGNPAQLEAWTARINDAELGVSARVVRQLSSSEERVIGLLQSLLVLVTVVITLLTFLCVATTMLATILERRVEIGLKKALGAGDASILGEFLGECLALGAVGGVLGMALGYGLTALIGQMVFGRAVLPGAGALAFAFGSSVLVAVAAGVGPVLSTTKIDPALVLKGE